MSDPRLALSNAFERASSGRVEEREQLRGVRTEWPGESQRECVGVFEVLPFANGDPEEREKADTAVIWLVSWVECGLSTPSDLGARV